jgi:uncharacterized membrane protein
MFLGALGVSVAEILPGASMLVALAAIACLAVLAAPLSRDPFVYLLFSFVCHQQPERSLWLAGAPLAVCARCAGVYFGAFLGLLLQVPVRRGPLLAAVALLALDWITEAAGVREPWVAVRWTTGCLAGMAGAAVCGEAWKEWWVWCRKAKSAKPA